MSEEAAYTERLAEALERRRSYLDEKVLPKLKESFRTFHTSYQGLFNILQRKGLVQEDPYKNDQKISEVEPPSDEHFLDSEKDQIMSVRLSAFDSTLDYLTNYFEFSLEHIDLKRVKNLVGLANFIKWSNLSEASPRPTTRTLAEYAAKLRSDADPLSTNLLKDSVEQLTKNQQTILKLMKQIATFKREEYKLYLREEVVPESGVASGKAYENRDQSIKQIRKSYVKKNPGGGFFGELAAEVVDEDFGPDGESLRGEVLQTLEVKDEKAAPKQKADSLRPVLMDGIRSLAGASRPLEGILQGIHENIELLENRRKGFGERFREWIDRLVNREESGRVYDVEYLDEATNTAHTERIDYDSFRQQIQKRARLYGAILSKVSNVSRKLEGASEDQLFAFLQKHVEELYVAQRQLKSLDTHIRAEAPRAQRNSLVGVNTELQTLQEAVTKANKKKHAYVAKKEEQEQFARLGVNGGAPGPGGGAGGGGGATPGAGEGGD